MHHDEEEHHLTKISDSHKDAIRKAEILQRSINQVHEKAQRDAEIRTSPQRYLKVKSKVGGNMKVQNKIAKTNKKVMSSSHSNLQLNSMRASSAADMGRSLQSCKSSQNKAFSNTSRFGGSVRASTSTMKIT
jgi:hypothetical protein